MSVVLAVVLLLLIFVAVGGYYQRSRFKGTGLASVVGVVLVILVVLWYAAGGAFF